MSVTIRDMLSASVHFGHQTNRWNPKMKPFIYGAHEKVYIIDLNKTLGCFNNAIAFVKDQVAKGERIIFVGTKRQAQDVIKEEALRSDMFFVNNRWLGGTLTNFKTICASIDRLKKLRTMEEDGTVEAMTKKEGLSIQKDIARLEKYLGGIKDMKKVPSMLYVIDPNKEKIAIKEAKKLGIKVIALTDTNCDPDGVDFVIPGNDDAIKSIQLFTKAIADACIEGASHFKNFQEMKSKNTEPASSEVGQETSAPQEGEPEILRRGQTQNA